MASEQAQPESDSSPEGSNVPAENPSTDSADPSAQTEIDLGAAAQDTPTEPRATTAETASAEPASTDPAPSADAVSVPPEALVPVPTTATACGRPRTRTFSTAKPVAGEWKVTRSMVPVMVSAVGFDDETALSRMRANRR